MRQCVCADFAANSLRDTIDSDSAKFFFQNLTQANEDEAIGPSAEEHGHRVYIYIHTYRPPQVRESRQARSESCQTLT